MKKVGSFRFGAEREGRFYHCLSFLFGELLGLFERERERCSIAAHGGCGSVGHRSEVRRFVKACLHASAEKAGNES